MSYTDRWQTARFRDIEFLTDSHEAKSGRRLAVHEFPGAELPVVEDLGGQANGWTLNAYFLGADYDTECDALIAALNKPGADWLIHPWLGRLWVRARSWTRRETNQEQGFCTLSIEFVPGGEQPPAASQDKVDSAQAAIDDLSNAAVADADASWLDMSLDGIDAFAEVVRGGLEQVRTAISLSALPLTWARQLLNGSAGLQTDVAALMAVPRQYSNALHSLMNSLGLGGDDAGLVSSDRPRVVSRVSMLASRGGYTALNGLAKTDPVVRKNLTTESQLQNRLLLASAMQLTLTTYTSEAERGQCLASIDAAYDVVLPTLPDVVFQAAVSARTALIAAVMAQDLKPQQIRDVVQPLPSTVLAHRMQIDEAVLIARNGVRHPLFVRGRVYG